jgi:hypothetical protein
MVMLEMLLVLGRLSLWYGFSTTRKGLSLLFYVHSILRSRLIHEKNWLDLLASRLLARDVLLRRSASEQLLLQGVEASPPAERLSLSASVSGLAIMLKTNICHEAFELVVYMGNRPQPPLTWTDVIVLSISRIGEIL